MLATGFGERCPEFEADLRGLLRQVAPAGLMAERQRDILVNVYRVADDRVAGPGA